MKTQRGIEFYNYIYIYIYAGRNLSSSDPALNELEQKEIRDSNQMEVNELNYEGRHGKGVNVRLNSV